MYRRLQDALVSVKDNTIVIAEDISNSGQKVFRVAAMEQLHQKYLELKQPHWYECLLEGRPSRIFLDIDSNEPIELDGLLKTLDTAIQHKFGKKPIIEILNSCGADKYSWHIIVTNIWLKNVYHVGAFVRRLVLATKSPAIDTAVYTKNRMFRLCGSSKFGSDRCLRHPAAWHALLVQGSGCYTKDSLECLEIDESEPVSSSQNPFDLFRKTATGYQRSGSAHRGETSTTSCPMLRPIVQHLDHITNGSVYWHKTAMTNDGQYMVSTRSKQCAIAGRCHKGNNIWFLVKPMEKRVFQRCYDEECRSRAHEISIDSSLWSMWHNEWSALARTPKNENTLYNMVD